MKAVHFGAGNIGRGFVGLLLHEGGYDLVFSDVAAPLVDAVSREEPVALLERFPVVVVLLERDVLERRRCHSVRARRLAICWVNRDGSVSSPPSASSAIP